MNLFSLNIIICIILLVICWVIWAFATPDSLKISTRDVAALIATVFIILLGFLPFITPETDTEEFITLTIKPKISVENK